MSKHIFIQKLEGIEYQLQLGWDKFCQYYYCVISKWMVDASFEDGGYFDDENPIYSNLDTSLVQTLELLVDICLSLGFIMPEGIVENIKQDKQKNAVNRVVIYE